MTRHLCKQCSASLSGDEIALFKKLVFRGATEYLCLCCMADRLGVKKETLEELIRYYHRTGICSLFAKTGEHA